MSRMIRRSRVPALLLAVAALGCDAPRDGAPVAGSAGGIVIAPSPSVSIGELDGPPEYVFSRIEGAQLLPNERVAVADGASGTIRVFGADGTLESQFGGIGQGPGEFEYLTELLVLPPDTILVYDSRALRLSTFRVDGQLLGTLGFEASDGWPEVYHGRYSDAAHAVSWIQQSGRDRTVVSPDLMRVVRFDASGQLLNELATSPGMRRQAGPLPFSAHFMGALVRDTLFYTDGLSGTVHSVASSGEATQALELPLSPLPSDHAWVTLSAELDSARRADLSDFSGLPGADSVPVISELLADAAGRLWLKEYDPGSDSHWLGRQRAGGTWIVSDTQGNVIARVSAPAGLRLLDVGVDRVVGVAYDDLGVERVQVHALIGG